MEATVDPLSRGPDWMPITPKRGSLFHAETHPVYVGSFIEWMVSEGYLADGDIHSRAMLEEALALYIADQISRHR
jgi:hypothetical protein